MVLLSAFLSAAKVVMDKLPREVNQHVKGAFGTGWLRAAARPIGPVPCPSDTQGRPVTPVLSHFRWMDT